jgi:DNA-binding response OmpR family regulator
MTDKPAEAVPARPVPGVLVAEDQAGLRGLLCLALSSAGFRVLSAADGDEAVRLYREHRDEIDAVLLDRAMPRKDGPAALAELRALCSGLPCCLMTGAGPEAEEELRSVGASRVLAKPFDLPEMVAIMQELCAPRVAPGPLRVLAADGDPNTADALCRMMALWGHEARAALPGPHVLTAAAEFGPDVIVLDPALPGVDGFEVARRLHDLPGLKGVVFVALTSQTDEEYRRLTREAGFALHIVKQPDVAELEAALGELAREKAKRPPDTP